jgi:DNA-binding PadR family transcriptional regulator
MARTNRTEYAILGLLALGPRSGYDIKRDGEDALGHFWHESYGHIYPILKRLHSHGLTERHEERDEGRPTRHVYTLTADGRAELEAWLAEPVERTPPRNELLLKLFFGRLTTPGVLHSLVSDYRDRQAEALVALESVGAVLEAEAGSDLPYWMMTRDLGLRAMRTFLDWADDTLDELDRMKEDER